MITHHEFRRLRLRHFIEDVIDLFDWQFEGRAWVGEAVGFSEWLRPIEDPEALGSMALDLSAMSVDVGQEILDHIRLPLRAGMVLGAVTDLLGDPLGCEVFVSDRRSYEFRCGAPDAYAVSCTIHDNDGLTYVVVTPAANEP